MEKKVRPGLIAAFLKELDSIPSSRKHLREFGLLVGGVLAVLGAYWAWRGKSFWPFAAAPGSLLILLGAAAPSALKGPHRLWMGLALLMGAVMTRLILTLFYYLFLTPIAWILRLTGQYPVSFRKASRTEESYWTLRPDAPVPAERYGQQF